MYLTKTPAFIKKTFPRLTWEYPEGDKKIYLTFDDGPHPEITLQVLDILKTFGARATFFCVGENILRYPDVFEKIRRAGHQTGSHTHRHLNGWKTNDVIYLQDAAKASKLAQSILFRPPYGRIRLSQIKKMQNDFQIVMWSVLSGDFDPSLPPEKCLNNVIRYTKDGSVVVFHDSEKAADRMLYSLPGVLKFFSEKGFRFEAIPRPIKS